MSKKKRSERRHHRERMENRARKVCRRFWSDAGPNDVGPERFAVRLADNLAVCSGPCCGNPRKHFGSRTRQEKKAARVTDWDD